MHRWLLAAALSLPAALLADIPVDDEAPLPIMAVPAPLREQFVETVLTGKPSRVVRLERMVNFVLDAQGGLGMRYEDGATHTVEESWATRQANCLGFTLLFLALAREAGLEAWPQVYEQTLAWHRAEGILYRSSHVNAAVRIGPRTFTLDAARGEVITRGRPVRLSQVQLLARYHNNLAIDAMKAGDIVTARQRMATSLDLDAGQASHWSNAGVLELHAGNDAAARLAYEKALSLDPENTNALFNMVNLARRAADREREDAFRAQLERVQEKDPFHHFLQAIDYELAGDFANAVEHYRRATLLHRGDHRLHSALAGALERAGDHEAARDSLRRAVALSEGETREAYRKRLQALRGR